MKKIYKRIRSIILIVLVFALASLTIYGGREAWIKAKSTSTLQPLTMRIKPEDFKLKIPAIGELQSSESVVIAVPPVPVNRLKIATVVPDGTRVKKGDVIVEFDPAELDMQQNEYKASLEVAKQKLTKSELSKDEERADITKDKKIAQLELDKINEFIPRDEQIYSRRAIIEGQLDKDYTEKKIVFADARFELKGKVYSLNDAILKLEHQQADNKINQLEKALTSLKLVAPVSGIVLYNDPGYFYNNRTPMPGRTVWIGMSLFSVVNPEKIEAKCSILEKDAGELRVNEPVSFSLDPYPDVKFSGKIKMIDKLARPIERESPVKYFQATVTVDKTDMELMKPGVKLKAEVLAGELKSVIVIPRSAIVKKGSEFFAYVQKGSNQFDPVAVSLGQGDLIQAVITNGLKPGELLALNPPDIKDFSPTDKKKDKNPELTIGIEEIIIKAVEHKPRNRFSATQMEEALKNHLLLLDSSQL